MPLKAYFRAGQFDSMESSKQSTFCLDEGSETTHTCPLHNAEILPPAFALEGPEQMARPFARRGEGISRNCFSQWRHNEIAAAKRIVNSRDMGRGYPTE